MAPAIGIDLGTTNSCVALFREGQVEIIPNDHGNRTTPSCVAFCDTNGRLIGEAAHSQLTINPTYTIFDVKRLIGRRFSDAKVQQDMKLWPFKVIQGTSDIPTIVVSYDGKIMEFSPEEICSMLLTEMKNIVETFLGTTVQDAVITVPAYFNDSQRQATKDAGFVAGLNVLQLVNEPTAAAIAYHQNKRYHIACQRNVLVFDLGGGTFDVSLVTIDGEGEIVVKAVKGDPHLGGQDFNNKMVDHFVKEFSRNHTTSKSIKENLRALERLRVSCEKAKQMLSSSSETTIELDCLHEGIDFSTRITRAKFEHLNADLFSKCIKMVESCLKDARIEKVNVDEVVLVGGSTRIPKVQHLLQKFFNGKKLCKRIHADEAVAYGAAVLAANLSGDNNINEKVKNLVLLDVTPLSLGVEIRGGIMFTLIPRNTRMPVKMEYEYVTINDNRNAAVLVVYQGERSRPKEYNRLGKFTLPVSSTPMGKLGVRVVFEIDSSGILSCSGEGLTNSHQKFIITDHKGRLSEEEIKKMVKDAENYKCEATEYLQKVTARNMLEACIYNVKTKLNYSSTWRNWFYKEDIKKLENAIKDAIELSDLRKLVDVNEYKNTREELEKLCDFMN